jgi:hypothetical protein
MPIEPTLAVFTSIPQTSRLKRPIPTASLAFNNAYNSLCGVLIYADRQQALLRSPQASSHHFSGFPSLFWAITSSVYASNNPLITTPHCSPASVLQPVFGYTYRFEGRDGVSGFCCVFWVCLLWFKFGFWGLRTWGEYAAVRERRICWPGYR